MTEGAHMKVFHLTTWLSCLISITLCLLLSYFNLKMTEFQTNTHNSPRSRRLGQGLLGFCPCALSCRFLVGGVNRCNWQYSDNIFTNQVCNALLNLFCFLAIMQTLFWGHKTSRGQISSQPTLTPESQPPLNISCAGKTSCFHRW